LALEIVLFAILLTVYDFKKTFLASEKTVIATFLTFAEPEKAGNATKQVCFVAL